MPSVSPPVRQTITQPRPRPPLSETAAMVSRSSTTPPAKGMFLTLDQVAKRFGRSKVWVRRQVKAGLMPHRRGVGSRSIFFLEEDLAEFLARTYQGPVSEERSA